MLLSYAFKFLLVGCSLYLLQVEIFRRAREVNVLVGVIFVTQLVVTFEQRHGVHLMVRVSDYCVAHSFHFLSLLRETLKQAILAK